MEARAAATCVCVGGERRVATKKEKGGGDLVPGGNFPVFEKTLLHSRGESVEEQIRHHNNLPCGSVRRGVEEMASKQGRRGDGCDGMRLPQTEQR